jgi:hypothetical protein
VATPPGKQTDPIGDQVTWEQILCRFVGKTKLWIVTRDSDYGSMYGGKGFFNQFLYEELVKVSPVRKCSCSKTYLMGSSTSRT